MRSVCALGLVMMAGLVSLGPAIGAEGRLTLDLNGLEPIEAGCRATFVGHNGLAEDIARTGFEMVLFSPEGLVTRMVVLDFGALDAGRTKVMQFTLAGTECAGIGRVLINDVERCEGPADAGACLGGLVAESRSGIAFGL
ncbi:hypothetical protein EMQ25_01030 [Arsenicitalea aurantiaca]|uniref:Tat pathway signal sequence domain protein n=1 Tax=Arsenicitalea aurantiaca TaxID=1783274 RepID=A0A433XKP2_9HYPH|nr:hypothetical protein [Arsenicitalea aurantiaca]RUT34578.1 hypothetical protein EMQ25_01030 [Arsenicitalea aurantiaca]